MILWYLPIGLYFTIFHNLMYFIFLKKIKWHWWNIAGFTSKSQLVHLLYIPHSLEKLLKIDSLCIVNRKELDFLVPFWIIIPYFDYDFTLGYTCSGQSVFIKSYAVLVISLFPQDRKNWCLKTKLKITKYFGRQNYYG